MAVIKDRNGRKIAYTTTEGHRTVIRDRCGKGLGQFRNDDNSTRDMNGRLVTKGNTLSSFLKW